MGFEFSVWIHFLTVRDAACELTVIPVDCLHGWLDQGFQVHQRHYFEVVD